MAMLVYRRVDTKNDALENISPFKHGVILGIYVCFQGCTFSQTDMAPENGSLEHYFPFGSLLIFRGEPLVSGSVFHLLGVQKPTDPMIP